jgi:transposase-like protein
MDRDNNERDEAIVDARVTGVSTRALAKQHGCTGPEIEEAVDRRLSYELDNRQRLRLVKLSVARIEGLMRPFYERATKDRDVAAGTLCCKLEERLSLLLGLDQPTQSRVDVYQVEAQQQPSSHEKIRDAIMHMVEQAPPAERALRKRLDELSAEQALALLNAGNGQALDSGHTTGTELPDRSK